MATVSVSLDNEAGGGGHDSSRAPTRANCEDGDVKSPLQKERRDPSTTVGMTIETRNQKSETRKW